VLDKTGSLPVSFPVQIIYRIVSYRITPGTASIVVSIYMISKTVVVIVTFAKERRYTFGSVHLSSVLFVCCISEIGLNTF